jgi:hypothetical protein
MILPGQQKQPALRNVVSVQATAPGPAISADCGWQDSHWRGERVAFRAWALVWDNRRVSVTVRRVMVVEGAILRLISRCEAGGLGLLRWLKKP